MVQYTQIYEATCAVIKTALSQIFKRDGDFLIINGVLNTYGGYAKEIRDTEDKGKYVRRIALSLFQMNNHIMIIRP